MPSTLHAWAVLVATLLASLVPAHLSAQTADDLFDPDTLHEVRLFINSRDLRELRDRFTENIYFPADMHWGALRVRNVGVRSRGETSRSRTKPGLHVDLGRYVSGQRFLGLGSLVINNQLQDPTLLREYLAMAFLSRMGQPAPRVSLARIYINNTYQGVYTLTEDVNADFLQRRFDDTAGFLFEFRRREQPYYGEYLGDDLAPYQALFEPRTRRLEADSVLYSPIRDLFREVNQPVDALWRERVEAFIDLQQFVAQAAIGRFTWEQDGLLGAVGMNNFYLYRPDGSTRHRIIPWDKDLVFLVIHDPFIVRGEENELFRRALAYHDLRALYLRTLEESARMSRTDDWLLNTVLGAAALISEAAHADSLKPFTNEAFDEGVAFLVAFAKERPQFVLDELEQLRSP